MKRKRPTEKKENSKLEHYNCCQYSNCSTNVDCLQCIENSMMRSRRNKEKTHYNISSERARKMKQS